MGKRDSYAEITILFFIMVIGAAEAAHLSGVFFHRPVSQCTVIFGVLSALSAVALSAFEALWFRKAAVKEKVQEGRHHFSLFEKLLLALFVFLAASQILFILIGKNVYMQGDMTVETVGSFLETDVIYQVNPMTGQAYAEGLPLRMEILCLPTLYAALSGIFRISPDTLVLYIVPVITLLCCYGAYGCLAKALFPGRRSMQIGFLAMAAFLIWIGSYGYGMDGFGLLFSGWRGVTIRNAVLIPYTLSLCLRGKYMYLPLCLLAEACIVWTFYGLGACLPVILGMLLIRFLRRRQRERRETADGGIS